MTRQRSGPWAVALALASTTAVLAIRVEIDDSVPHANARAGSPPSVVIDDYALTRVAQGSDPLENPSGSITTFGYLNDARRTKTEPDENTYLVLNHNPGGPTSGFEYGRHFLFQGHENGGGLAYITASIWTSPIQRIESRC